MHNRSHWFLLFREHQWYLPLADQLHGKCALVHVYLPGRRCHATWASCACTTGRCRSRMSTRSSRCTTERCRSRMSTRSSRFPTCTCRHLRLHLRSRLHLHQLQLLRIHLHPLLHLRLLQRQRQRQPWYHHLLIRTTLPPCT